MKYPMLFLILVISSCSDTQRVIDPLLEEREIEEISVRNAHAMVYHPREFNVYLFGGADQEKVLSDLWKFEDSKWKIVTTKEKPEARTFGCMVYEEYYNRIILFGGSKVLFGNDLNSSNLLNDTWEFKNEKWVKINCPISPGARAEAEMVYDKVNKKTILFGGYSIKENQIIKLADTWVFEKNNWQLVSEKGPSERHGAAMGFDDENNYVVLFGGSTIDKQYGEGKGETWVWENESWMKENTNNMDGLFNSTSAYDFKNKSFIIFGGWNGKKRVDHTIRYYMNKWERLNPKNAPSPRNHSRMVYDEKNRRMILFGGHNGKEIFGDTWEYIDNNWNKILETKPKRRISNGH